ncbi:MAG: hypothetical protein ACE5J2_06165 [Nitrososphaerales archaeon]
MRKNKQATIFPLVFVALASLVVLSIAIVPTKTYADVIIEGIIVYEQPTDIAQLGKIPLQVVIGLGVVLAAIAIFVLYKVRK